MLEPIPYSPRELSRKWLKRYVCLNLHLPPATDTQSLSRLEVVTSERSAGDGGWAANHTVSALLRSDSHNPTVILIIKCYISVPRTWYLLGKCSLIELSFHPLSCVSTSAKPKPSPSASFCIVLTVWLA